jgi:DNA-binding NtrC family response regulator
MKILFIDDNTTIHKVYYEMLKKFNYINDDDEFDSVYSVNDLIEKDISFFNEYKVIISDLDLGSDQKSGLYFLNSIGKDYKGVKVLFTGNSTESLEKMMNINNDKILISKPGGARNIQTVVNELGRIIIEQR